MNGRLWTEAEDAILRELVGKQPYTAIGQLVGGRSGAAVHDRAKRIGVHVYMNRCEKHHAAKLTNLQVAMIATLLDAGFTPKEVTEALDLPVKTQAVRDLRSCTTWKENTAMGARLAVGH